MGARCRGVARRGPGLRHGGTSVLSQKFVGIWRRRNGIHQLHTNYRLTTLEDLSRHLDWLAHHRDPDGDGLLTILLPDESGLDDSPKYDPVYGHTAHYRLGHARLLHRCRRLGWDSRAIIASGEHHVEDVLVNVAYVLSLRAMARLSGEARWSTRADATVQALLDRCRDEERGLFFDLAGHAETQV